MTIGQRIKEARKSAGLTQRELAEKAGTATGTIQQYELGKRQPRIEQFQAIADVLNVDVNWLMNGYTLAQRDQAFRDFVKKRFSEVEVWKTRLDEIGQDLGKLNDEGEVEAVKRDEETLGFTLDNKKDLETYIGSAESCVYWDQEAIEEIKTGVFPAERMYTENWRFPAGAFGGAEGGPC